MNKKLVFIIVASVLVIFLFLRPILPYLPKAVMLARMYMNARVSDIRSEDGRTNFLILGLGGPKNEPSGLTDTIIFASADHNGNEVLLLSIPRDIWVPEMRAKINSAYYYGNRSEGLGMEWARRYVSQIVGQSIHYVVVVSFDGFVEIIDLVGGTDFLVERSFADDKYPIPGKEDDNCDGDPEVKCRYEIISFSEGWQHFDGETALKFVRSRQSEGLEGGDFARSGRQQKVILALKDVIVSPKFYLNPNRISQALSIISQSTETDIPESHFAALAKLGLLAKNGGIRSEVLTEGNGIPRLLIHPPISAQQDNQWVLVPKEDSWEATQRWVACLFTGKSCPVEDFVTK